MRTKTKALALALCAVLLVVTTVFVTMAFLTSKDSVKNTFTVGKVTITLDEADVKNDGTYESNKEARVDTNEYKLIPGHTYIKDPTIHVADDSEECWLCQGAWPQRHPGQLRCPRRDPDGYVCQCGSRCPGGNGRTIPHWPQRHCR